MKKLRDIMRSGFLFMVQRDAMVTEAVRLMVEYNVGIVIVMDGWRVAGVFSERDVARRVVDGGLDPARTRVRDVMTPEVITADVDEDYQAAMSRMDEANIRHLLVVDDGVPMSMVSIRDLIRVDLQDKNVEIGCLREYLYQVPPEIAGRCATSPSPRP
jgi:CBS domain-containing protein